VFGNTCVDACTVSEAIMKCICRTAGYIYFAVMSSLALPVAVGPAASSGQRTITCPYLKAEDLKFNVPPNIGDLPSIDFDYPAKVTTFSFREGHLLLVAMDEDEPSRLRIVISAQLSKVKGTYSGQIVVDMGGHELQLSSGPVSCRVGHSQRQR
jgi:hypothetical protein